MALPPSPRQSPPPQGIPQSSQWSLFEPTSKQASCSSSISVDSGYESETGYPDPSQRISSNVFNFYGNLIPFQEQEKAHYHQAAFASPAVAVF
jgi:hypothetical protein